jgi:chromosome partitioning protein
MTQNESFILTFMSPKGGVGKSTAAIIFASEMIRLGNTVAIIEADRNAHISTWYQKGRAPKGLTVTLDEDATGATLPETIERCAPRADYVIIDTEGTQNPRAAIAASAADIVLIPMSFSSLDLNGAIAALTQVDAIASNIGRPIPAAILPSRVNAAIMTRSRRAIEASLTVEGIPVIMPGVLDKEVYRAIFAEGALLHDLPKYTDVSGISSAIDNAQAIMRSLVQFMRDYQNQ